MTSEKNIDGATQDMLVFGQYSVLIFVMLFLFLLPTPSHAATCTNTLTSGTTIPQGYGAAYNLFTSTKELLVRGTCSGTTATLTLGSPQTYTYKTAYTWSGTAWKPHTLTCTGTQASSAWCIGTATAQTTLTENPTALLGYACSWVNNAWKCGCRDTTCTTSSWQMQRVGVSETVPTTSGKLMFSSGFENSVRIASSSDPRGGYIKGIDASRPSGANDWDRLSTYLPWAQANGGYFESGSMKIGTDHVNSNNKVLHFHNYPTSGAHARSQWSLQRTWGWVDPGGGNLYDKQFYRYRMYIPTALRDAFATGDNSSWYMIWESHAWDLDNTRHGIYLVKNGNSREWRFEVVQQRPEGVFPYIYENLAQQNVTVPFGEWFTLEVFFKYHETNGEFYAAIVRPGTGRQVIGHFVGKTQNGTMLRDQMVFKMYHDASYFRRLPNGTDQYYDDFEIWSDYPPGYF